MRKYGSPRTYQIRGLQAEGTAADLQFQIARPEPQRISYDVHSPVCLTKRSGQIQYHLSPLDFQHHKRPKTSRCQLIGYSHFNVTRIQPYVITYFDTAGVDRNCNSLPMRTYPAAMLSAGQQEPTQS